MADDSGRERAISAVVTGRVQGVGYRFTTQSVGSRLGLTGWVRNQHDGSVLVWAQGSREVIARFVGFLEKGPPAARVRAVDTTEQSVDPALDEFTVRY